jgi:hypothetical protein
MFKAGKIVAAAVLVFLIGMWLCWPGLNRMWLESRIGSASSVVAEHGQFGDSFGSLNSLFTGLAFFGAIVAVLLQHQALTLQVGQFRDAQRDQRLVDEMIVLQASLERVDYKLAETDNASALPASAAQCWQLQQRQTWMMQRRTIEARLAEIGEVLGWHLPQTTPPDVTLLGPGDPSSQ